MAIPVRKTIKRYFYYFYKGAGEVFVSIKIGQKRGIVNQNAS